MSPCPPFFNFLGLLNDHKTISKLLEELLFRIVPNGSHSFSGSAGILQSSNRPFIKANKVMANSVAASAGILPGDLIVRLGSIDYASFNDLEDISREIQKNRHLNSSILGISIVREGQDPLRFTVDLSSDAPLG